MTEQHIMLAAKFYDARRCLRQLFGDEYSSKVSKYRDVILAIMERQKLQEILAVKWLLEKAERDNVPPEERGNLALWLLAAAVDLSEGIGKTLNSAERDIKTRGGSDA